MLFYWFIGVICWWICISTLISSSEMNVILNNFKRHFLSESIGCLYREYWYQYLPITIIQIWLTISLSSVTSGVSLPTGKKYRYFDKTGEILPNLAFWIFKIYETVPKLKNIEENLPYGCKIWKKCDCRMQVMNDDIF